MRISPEPHARSSPNFSCMFPASVAQSSSNVFTIGRIAGKGFSSLLKMLYQPGKWDGSAQHGRSMLATIALFYFAARRVCLRACLCADFTCSPGQFLDISSDQECHDCPSGTFSLGGGVLFKDWKQLPTGFTTSLYSSATLMGSDRHTENHCSG